MKDGKRERLSGEPLGLYSDLTTREGLQTLGGEVYDACKEIDGYPGEGTFPIVAQRVLNFYWPWDRQVFYEPIGSYDRLLQVVRLNAHLLEGYAPEWCLNGLQVSFRVFESARTAPGGRLALPKEGDGYIIRKHAVRLDVAWEDDGERLGFVNSWGGGWGDKGRGWLTREYAERYMTEAWLRRRAHVGPNRFTFRRLMDAPTAKEYAKVWMIPNPRRRARFTDRGRGRRFVLYETLSMDSDCPVDVIELRNGTGLRLGWAHLFHVRGGEPPTSILKELFVWPWFRGQGYGTGLERFAVERARMARSTRMQILLHEADALPRNRGAGRGFAERCGYTWRWRRSTCPNIAAVGQKDL